MVVGTTTIKPGTSTTVSMEFMMHEGMAGPHDFRVPLKTNDPATPERTLTVLSDWGP